jgi:hypothetical protein
MGCLGWVFRVAAQAVVWSVVNKALTRFLARR